MLEDILKTILNRLIIYFDNFKFRSILLIIYLSKVKLIMIFWLTKSREKFVIENIFFSLDQHGGSCFLDTIHQKVRQQGNLPEDPEDSSKEASSVNVGPTDSQLAILEW